MAEPVAANVSEYAVPCDTVPNVDVVIVGPTADPTVPLYAWVVVPKELAHCNVTEYEAAVVGTPYRFPAVDSDRPAGRLPDETVHTSGAVPVA